MYSVLPLCLFRRSAISSSLTIFPVFFVILLDNSSLVMHPLSSKPQFLSNLTISLLFLYIFLNFFSTALVSGTPSPKADCSVWSNLVLLKYLCFWLLFFKKDVKGFLIAMGEVWFLRFADDFPWEKLTWVWEKQSVDRLDAPWKCVLVFLKCMEERIIL